jgi:lysophospholipase L1-like esterase
LVTWLLAVPAQAYGIAGDAATTAGAYPFVAKVDTGERSCSGVLVDPQWILTVKSCFGDAVPAASAPPPTPTTVIVGRSDLSQRTGVQVGVAELSAHPSLDVALAKLVVPVAGVAPVALGGAPETGQVLRAAGFGRTANEWVPDRLRVVEVRVEAVTDDEYVVAALGDGGTLCQGDAGGPTLREASGRVELVGVHGGSRQAGCLGSTETEQGAADVRTDALAGWILQHTAEGSLNLRHASSGSIDLDDAFANHAMAAGAGSFPSIVEQRDYPEAEAVLAERGIRLKKGDGHITLVQCAGTPVPNLIEVRSVVGNKRFCFLVNTPPGYRASYQASYLTLELPETYLLKGDTHDVTATLTAGGETTTVDLPRDGWVSVGTRADPAGAPATLTALRANNPLRIMPLGDSITELGCWRAMLWEKLRSTGYTNVDFVGNNKWTAECSVSYDGDNEGHGGYLATDVASQNQLPGWLSATRPDIVLMHFGTNDVWGNRSTSAILAAYDKLVDQMRASNPNMKVFVAQIIPMNHSTCGQCAQRVVDLNNAIPGWARAKSTAQSPVIVVDQWAGFDTTTDTSDGVHPIDSGSRKISNRWYLSLVADLSATT